MFGKEVRIKMLFINNMIRVTFFFVTLFVRINGKIFLFNFIILKSFFITLIKKINN